MMLDSYQRQIFYDIEDEYTNGNSFTSDEEELVIWLLENGWL